MLRKATGVNLDDSFSDDSSLDIDEYQNINHSGELLSNNQVGDIIRDNED